MRAKDQYHNRRGITVFANLTETSTMKMSINWFDHYSKLDQFGVEFR